MLLQIFMVILLILIVLVLLLFLKPFHVYLAFKNHNLDCGGIITINHNIFTFIYDIGKQLLIFKLAFGKHEFNLAQINTSDMDVNIDVDVDADNDDGESQLDGKLKELYPLLKSTSSDLHDIMVLLVEMCKFDKSSAIINFGLMDNNLTIKICNYIWAITAPLYPLNIELLLMPEINKSILKTDIDIRFSITLKNILIIGYKVIANKNILKMINIIRKW